MKACWVACRSRRRVRARAAAPRSGRRPAPRARAPAPRRARRLRAPAAGDKSNQCVQAGGDAGHPDVRSVTPELGDEPVTSTPVGEPRAANMPVVGAGGNQLGEGQLVEHAVLAVDRRLRSDDVVDQIGGQREPAEPQPWRYGTTRGRRQGQLPAAARGRALPKSTCAQHGVRPAGSRGDTRESEGLAYRVRDRARAAPQSGHHVSDVAPRR